MSRSSLVGREEHSRWRNSRCKGMEAGRNTGCLGALKNMRLPKMWGAECGQ